MADETSRAATWLKSTLSHATLTALATGGVWEHPAPQGTVFPAVTFNLLSDRDVATGAGHYRIMSEQLWLIRAIVQAESFASASTMADVIDGLLDRKSGSTPDGATIFSCVREGQFRLSEENSGLQFRHLGGYYRLLVQKA